MVSSVGKKGGEVLAMILQSRQWGFPLNITLIGLLTVCCLPRTFGDVLIISSSSLLLPYIFFTIYNLLLPAHFLRVRSKLSFYHFSIPCAVPPPRIPEFLACYCSIGGEVQTGKLFIQSCSRPVPWHSVIRRVIK